MTDFAAVDDLSILLLSGYKFGFNGDEITNWRDERPVPSASEIAALRKALEDKEASTRHRRDRAAAYISDLGEEGDFQNTVGDVLDALIKWTQGDRAKLDGMAAKIADIKTRFPKP